MGCRLVAAGRWANSGVCSYLCLFFLGRINDGGTADLSDLPPLPVERPAADLVADHVFDEEHPPVEPQGELIKELDVLQHVVVRVAARDEGR